MPTRQGARGKNKGNHANTAAHMVRKSPETVYLDKHLQKRKLFKAYDKTCNKEQDFQGKEDHIRIKIIQRRCIDCGSKYNATNF
jgi:hypothetical protein